MRLMRRIYTVLMLLLAGFVFYAAAAKPWLQTDMGALLPHTQADRLVQAADAAAARQLNGQVLLLAGSADAAQAFQTAAEVAEIWRQSGVFAEVESSLMPDLAQVQADTLRLGLAVLPEVQRQQLFDAPEAYFQQRAEAAANPFAAPSPLPLAQDWLGFGRFAAAQANPQAKLQWHADTGMVFSEDEHGKTWVWLRGLLPENAPVSDGLLPLVAQSRELAEGKAEIVVAGGALFAAEAKLAAERESRIMGTAGLLLTFALLLWVFRSGRVFLLGVPLAAGLLCGLAASLAVFGEIHALTLVVGTSLVGMLVDFPLHWLTPAVFRPSEQAARANAAVSDGLHAAAWQPQTAMREVLPTFAVSLLVTALGYALLWFTPLPVLRQTAVFSGFALVGAFGATVCWLPPLFARYRARAVPFAAWGGKLLARLHRFNRRVRKRGWLLLAALLLAGGWLKSNWHDDIRQWTHLPPDLVQQAQQAAALGGAEWGGAYLVAEADSEDALLAKSAEVRRLLAPVMAAGKLGGVQSLDQFIAPTTEQLRLHKRLRELAKLPESWQPLLDLGIPRANVRQALNEAAAAPVLRLSDGLNTRLAEAWRPLYLGEVESGRFAAVIRLQGVQDAAAVRAVLQYTQGVHWAEQRVQLNQAFAQTRNQAAWLKLASFALALLLLWKLYGLRRGSRVLVVPLAAVAGTVAVLGWAGIPVGLFAMFGLLLVSAVGVDYALYAANAPHTAAARFGGLLLAALTTGISFALLGMSGTPAVAAFGITVAVGVVFNLWLAARLLPETPRA